MSDFLTKYHCILDYQSAGLTIDRLSMHAARCRSDRQTVQLMKQTRPCADPGASSWWWPGGAAAGLYVAVLHSAPASGAHVRLDKHFVAR